MQSWYFGLASMFAVMMYMLGFLLIAIPVPKAAGLKRYGRKLIHEGFNLIVTIFILNIFMTIVLSWQDVVWCAIYGTPSNCGIVGIEAFHKDAYRLVVEAHQHNVDALNKSAIGMTTVLIAASILTALAGGVIGWGTLPLAIYNGMQGGAQLATQLAYILSPVSSLYGTALLVSTFVVYFVEFIFNNWALLAAFGILLTIMPFNIGKRAGFFLIAFPVVSYIMIPLYALLGPIMAESIAGVAGATGWKVIQSYVDPAVVGMALAAPVTYLTFTTLAMSGLAAFTGASSIPLRGLPTNIGQMSHQWIEQAKRVMVGSPEAKQAGHGGLHTAKSLAKTVKRQVEMAKRGPNSLRYQYWLEGKTASGEKFKAPLERRQRYWKRREQTLQYFEGYRRAPVLERDGIFPVPSRDMKQLREGPSLDRKREADWVIPRTITTKKGEVVPTAKAIAERRAAVKRSILPHRQRGRGIPWGREDTVSQLRREARRRMLLRTARHDEKKAAEAAAAGVAWALGETPSRRSSVRSALEKFRESTMYRPRPSVHVRVVTERGMSPEEAMVFAAGVGKYESDENLRAVWRSHVRGRDPADYPEMNNPYLISMLRDNESSHFRHKFMNTYEAWEKGTLTDPRDQAFFMAHDAQIIGIRPQRIERDGRYYITGGTQVSFTLLGPILIDEGISPEAVETMRQMWTADPSGLAAAGRQHTRGWQLHTGPHASDPNRGGEYNPYSKYCAIYKANKWLSDPHMAHAFVVHEQMGHASFFGGFLPYMESEFAKANPELKIHHLKGEYACVAMWSLNGDYIRTHPDELNVTYERVASFSKNEVPSLADTAKDWQGSGEDKRTVLEGMYTNGLLQEDASYDPSEHHIEFHADSSGALTGLTIYRQRLSGDAQIARERFARFNRAIAETGGLTKYSWERLEKDGHTHDNFRRLRNWEPASIDGSMSENFAECTALFTAPDRSKAPGSRVTDFGNPKVREVEESWRDLESFIGARAIRGEKVYPYPY